MGHKKRAGKTPINWSRAPAPALDQYLSLPFTRRLSRLIIDSMWADVMGRPCRRYSGAFIRDC